MVWKKEICLNLAVDLSALLQTPSRVVYIPLSVTLTELTELLLDVISKIAFQSVYVHLNSLQHFLKTLLREKKQKRYKKEQQQLFSN